MDKIDNKLAEARDLFKLHWGFNEFRLGQEKAIRNILESKSTVVIMPTGGGKSLCYQLPALVMDGVAVVISPLIALMKNQVDSLQAIGVPATFINSSLTPMETKSRINMVQTGKYRLLYIAPERFYNQEFKQMLKDIKVSLFAIDEAHCISQWGHDFRPSYLKLKEAIGIFGNPPVLALTATATPEVREDIVRQLDLQKPELVITGFGRPNLEFGVIHANETKKPQLVMDALTSVPEGSGIIYVGTRARVDNLLQFLLENDIEAVGYHAGMDSADRKWVQDNFLSGKAKVIIATNAFGLGIDKPDIRFVIHYDMPGTVEAYYQEAGRAGRDGRPSFCLLLYNSRDRHLHEFFIKGDNPPPSMIQEIYSILLAYDSDIVLITYAELIEMLSDNVPDMAIGTSLKILEKEGYIARSRERTGQAYLKLMKDPKYIMDTFNQRARKQNELFAKLLERWEEEMMSGWQVNFVEIAEILELNKDSIVRLVRKLADQGLAEYQPPFKGTEIRILERVNPKELKLDHQALQTKLKDAYFKLDKIEEYIYSLDCRQKFILDYFGDLEACRCGRCDICVTGQGVAGRQKIKKTKDFDSAPRKSGKDFAVAKARPGTLGTKLTQLETMELFNDGFSVKEIAGQRGLKENTVVEHLCYLIEKGLIKDTKKIVDKNSEAKIKQAAAKLGKDKLKPIYEELDKKIEYDKIKIVLASIK